MDNSKKILKMLGMRVEDKITGFKGVVTSIAFDLYGCMQAIVNPGMDKDEKFGESHWFDISRLTIIDDNPIMECPNFEFGLISEGKKGPAEKPKYRKP
jgi:hypothetical protein